jgi:hypothetical protein
MGMVFKDKPRTGKFANKAGSYEQAIRVKTPVINPGDPVEIEQYFTGYGEIRSAKAICYPSGDLFNATDSYVLMSLKENEKGLLVFGGDKQPFKDTGITIDLNAGILHEGWRECTLFFDITQGGTPQLLTETKQDEAPFKYHLLTLKKIKPGNYYIEFYLSYFNGEVWKSSSKKVEFKIQNFFERHDVVLGWLALAVTISALVRFTLIPIIQWIATLCS